MNGLRVNCYLAGFFCILLSSCAQKLPLISHAHIGHAVTTWGDTPDQRGLFVVAQETADEALLQAELAWLAQDSPDAARQHMHNVVRALHPDLLSFDEKTDRDYGVIRALEGAMDHIEFAATSDDASLNFVSTAAGLVDQGSIIADDFKVSADMAHAALNSEPAEMADISFALSERLRFAVFGRDVDGDGIIGSAENETGLLQLNEQLNTMLKNERDPEYQPLPRKYVLGLIKLDNGEWAFDIKKSKKTASWSKYGY